MMSMFRERVCASRAIIQFVCQYLQAAIAEWHVQPAPPILVSADVHSLGALRLCKRQQGKIL